MDALYSANTLARFWPSEPEGTHEAWRVAAEVSAGLLPDGARVLAQHGWDGLMGHVLGEAQFGPRHFRLNHAAQLYYRLRPFLPRPVTAAVRHYHQSRQRAGFSLGWPIDDRYVRFVYQMLEHVRDTTVTPVQCGSMRGSPAAGRGYRGFWPDDADFAFVLTHDVERAAGQEFVRTLADIDERYGFRSSFNFVAEDYPVSTSLLAELRERGFEVGIHGLKHDGRLFSSRGAFTRAAGQINRYLREWDAVGFRSPSMHREPRWMQDLDIEYDASFFDTDPFEPIPGGTMSIWPFFCGRFVELPCTLVQDHTLFVVLRQRTPRLWLTKVDFIAQWGGLALINVHPDYMRNPAYLAVYEEFLQHMAEIMKRKKSTGTAAESSSDAPRCWHALPREVARWWRARAEVPA